MEKKAVGKQTGGFLQQRRGTRPYRVETLLGRGNDKRPSDLVERYEPQQPTPEQQFEGSLVGMVSDEFKKHSALEGMVEGPSPVVGATSDTITRHAAQEKERGRSQAARGGRRPEAEPHMDYVSIGKTGSKKLYHYGPKDVDLTVEGMKTPHVLDDPQVWSKYRGRVAGDLGKDESKVTREEALAWLEKSRGPGGSRMASVLHQPIGEGSSQAQRDYAGRRQLYEIDYDRARREGLIEGAHVVEESPKSQRAVRRRQLISELQKAKGFESDHPRMIFKGTPHGFLTLKGGHLPGKYLSKQGEDLYHGSPTNPTVLDPRKEHGDPRVPDAVFASPSRAFALAYAGRKWSDRDFNQSTQIKNGVRRVVMREMRPGAIEDVYQGASGYVHTVPDTSFAKAPRKGATWEQVSVSRVKPISTERIADTLLAMQKDPNVQFARYDPRAAETRSSIVRSVRRAREMEDGGKGYLKWRLKGAPPEISQMFREELQKTAGGPSPEFMERYKKLYEGFDTGHGPAHREQVARMARELAEKYDPKRAELAEIAGHLHDIGISRGRKGHEAHAVAMLKEDPEFKKQFGFFDRHRLLHAIKQHRRSSGWPITRMAKIVADADRVPAADLPLMRRSVEYRKKHHPEMSAEERYRDAARFITEWEPTVKTHYPETRQRLSEAVAPVRAAHEAGNLRAMRRLTRPAIQKTGAAPEFAPGIPANRAIKSIPRVPEMGANKEWTVSLSKHPAARRGDHHDMRLVDPRGQAHSWAFNELPEPGKGTYAAQQPTHSGKYARRKKPFSIPLGVYGGTRPGAKVEPLYVQPTEVISSSNDRVHFLRHHGQQTDEFVLKRLSKPVAGSSQSPMWAMRNTTRNRSTAEGKRLPDFKPRYKDTDPDQIDLMDREQVLTPKIDGAHTLVDFPKADKMMRVYSYRPTQRATGVIEHTFKFPNFQKRLVPRDLQGTIIRAETWASDREGRAIPASELGGLLNSSVPKSRAKQQDEGLKLRMTGIDVVRHKGKDYSNKPYAEKLDVIRKVTKLMRGVVEPPTVAHTPEQKKMLLSAVKTGKLPETKEGVVVHELNRDAPFQRAKIRPDHDVYVRRIDTKKSSPTGQASGFSYSFEPDGKIMGRVGTGLSTALRHDMAANPERYIGRVAKVQSAGRHVKRKDPSQGALTGSPAFKEWHIDKTPPELLKEGEFSLKGLADRIDLREIAEKVDPENLAAGYVETPRGKAFKPILQAQPVSKGVGKLRKAYRRLMRKKEDK